MIYTHRELKDKGMSNYNINKKVENMDKSLLLKLINIYCISDNSRINTTTEIANELGKIFNSPSFRKNVQSSRYNWIEEDTMIVLNTILDFIKQLEPLVV